MRSDKNNPPNGITKLCTTSKCTTKCTLPRQQLREIKIITLLLLNNLILLKKKITCKTELKKIKKYIAFYENVLIIETTSYTMSQ
jgi:hypothetical protein